MNFSILPIFSWLKSLFKPQRVFLDFASSTPIRKEVQKIMDSVKENFHNPSALYLEGRKAKELLEKARAECGAFLNCGKENIFFTSGGTEANNLFIFGVFGKAKENGVEHPHIISFSTEHPSVLESLKEIEKMGGEVTILFPDREGLYATEDILKEIKSNTVLISMMYVNNEIGVVGDIKGLGQRIRKWKKEVSKDIVQKKFKYPYFYSDCSQAPLYYSLDVSTLCLDGACIDGIKIFGPRGTGLLFVGDSVSIKPIVFGGGQERKLRSGTENVVGAVGLACALSLSKKERKDNFSKTEKIRDYFLEKIFEEFGEAKLNGSIKHRSPNNINICIKSSGKYLDAEYLVVCMDVYGVCLSQSSSCQNLKEDNSSYVVSSLGDRECGNSSLRFTVSPMTKKTEIDFAIKALKRAVKQVSLT